MANKLISRRIREALRDWWRGYRDLDVTILSMKIKQSNRPGTLILLNRRERNVIRAGILYTRTNSGVEPFEVTRPSMLPVYQDRRVEAGEP